MELYSKDFVYFDWDDKLEGKKGFVAQNITSLKNQVNDNSKLMVTLSSSGDDVCPFTYSCDDEKACDYVFAYYDPYYEFRKACLEGKQLQFKDYKGDWIDVAGEPIFTNDEYRIKPEYRIKSEWYVVLDDYGLSRTNEPSKNETVLSKGTEEECIECMEKYKQFEKILLAWKQGKTIQFKDHDKWVDWVIYTNPNTNDFDYWKEWRIKDECEGCMKYKDCGSNGIRCRNYCVEVTKYVPFDSVQELIDAWDNKYPQNKNRPEGTMPLIWIKNKQKNRVYLITDFLFDKYFKDDVGTEDSNLELKELFDDYTFLDGSIIGKRG